VGVLKHAGSTHTSVIMFAEEHSLRGPEVHFTNVQLKCHLSDVAGRCMVQVAGKQ
jgi:hypothetical protein